MLRDETILITGGAGFIGSHLVERLRAENRVRVLDTLDRDALTERGIAIGGSVELIRADVRDEGAVLAAMDGVDRVVHLASIAGVGTVLAHPVRTIRIAIEGTTAVLEAVRRSSSIRRVVDFSTSEVFGTHAFRVSETDDTPIGSIYEPRWAYAVSKIASEHLVHGYGREHGIPVVTIRPFNIYGPGQIGEGAIHHFVKRALAGEDITVYNDGQQVRSWCYIDDLVDGTLAALERDGAVGHAFNLGNPRASVTVLQLAEAVIRATGSGSQIVHVPREYPDVQLRVPDIENARRRLDFEPEVGLDDGIRRTAAWYESR